jgi:threonine/homoserine/homoserine lactone efflux protein
LPEASSLLLFLAATLALNVTPGPDMLYVVARGSGEGTRAGVVSAFGIATGTLVHLAAVALGLASLLAAVPLAYDAVRYAGAAYLIYLGLKALLTRGATTASRLSRTTLGQIYRQGVVTNVLNPKVALFFAAFLPQFADPARGPVLGQLVLLGLLFNLSGTTVNLIVAVAAGRAGEHLRERLGPAGPMRRITGVIFLGLGLRLALQRS